MGQSLIFRRHDELPAERRYVLKVRSAGLGGTDYSSVIGLPEEKAILLVRTGRVSSLYDDPMDHKARSLGWAGKLNLRWDRECADLDRSFVFEVLGAEPVTIAMLTWNQAWEISSCDVDWSEGIDWHADHEKAKKRQKVMQLREEADRLEAELAA